jgi:hypothetical protein
MAGGPSGLPQPPREEGVLGPGARKFITWLLSIAAVVGVIVLAVNVDFGNVADELDSIDETTTEEPNGEVAPDDEPAPPEEAEEADEPEAPPNPLSAAGIAAAIAALREEVGGNPHLVRLRVSPDAIELATRDGNRPIGYSWSDGELTELQVVVVTGSESLKDRDFLASTVDPKSFGRLLLGAERRAKRRLEVVNATLEADVVTPDRLRWLLNARAPNGSNHTYRATRDGRRIEDLGSSGPPGAGLPPQAREQFRDAERLTDCLRDAGSDTDAILECTQAGTP